MQGKRIRIWMVFGLALILCGGVVVGLHYNVAVTVECFLAVLVAAYLTSIWGMMDF